MAQVLVLNQDYRAISVCDPQRALVLILCQKAELISDRTDRKFRSVRLEYQFPSVIRLYRYVNLPYKKVALTRHNVFKRDGYSCVYCSSKEDLTLDHVLPRSQGGTSTWRNLVTACKKCNTEKGDRTPDQAKMPMKHKPYRPGFLMYLRQFSGHLQEDWKPFLLN